MPNQSSLPPLARSHEIDLTAATSRAHKPRVPLEDARLATVASGELGRVRLHSVLAPPAPYDEADAGRGRAAERHRWAGLGFHPDLGQSGGLCTSPTSKPEISKESAR